MRKTLFWLTYLVVALAATYHSYEVFIASDPPLIALASAIGVDVLLAYSLYVAGERRGDQHTAALVGIIFSVVVSGMAQVIQRNSDLGVAMPQWLAFVSLYIVPISTTGAMLVLGIVHYFEVRTGQGQRPAKQEHRPPVVERPPVAHTSNGRESGETTRHPSTPLATDRR